MKPNDWGRSASSETKRLYARITRRAHRGAGGTTPLVNSTGARYRLNTLSAISAPDELRSMITQCQMNADAFVDYCKGLLRGNRTARLRLFFRPGHPPEPDTDEWVRDNAPTTVSDGPVPAVPRIYVTK